MPVAQPLSREDLSILALENATVAGHTCKVILVQGQLGTGELRASIAGRLDRAPRLCLRLAERDGQPWWVPDPDLDLTAHVVESAAAGAGDDAALRAAVAGIFAQHLDRSRPLWRIDVIPAAGRRPQRGDLAHPPRAGRRDDGDARWPARCCGTTRRATRPATGLAAAHGPAGRGQARPAG